MSNHKPHLLMLTPYVPYPPVSGGRMRTYNLIKHLSVDYQITLVCFGRPEERAYDLTPMTAWCELIVVDRDPSPGTLRAARLSLTSLKPITMRLYGTAKMRRMLQQILAAQTVQLIHVESFYMMQNLPLNLKIPVLLCEPAIEYIVWRKYARVAPWYTRLGVGLEAAKMWWWSVREWQRAQVVGAMSGVDQGLIRERIPRHRVMIAPNGVDVEHFKPDPAIERDAHTAVYMGDYKYFPNSDAVVYFVRTIMPLIKAKHPDFRLIVLGKDPTPEILALAGEDVIVTGMVEDTRPYLRQAAVFICPLRSGSGTRFKLLEALSCGCPVVSTSTGCEGLDAVDGKHMLIRDDPGEFAEAVRRLMAFPEEGAALARDGRAWIVQRHAWSHSAALLREVYEQLLVNDSPTLA